MSSIWTPSGEHEPAQPATPGAAATGRAEEREAEPADMEAVREARAELAAVPVADIVANHAIGLWQLAVLHLTPEPAPDGTPTPPRLDEACLAIDALTTLVEGLGDRLAPHAEALRDALTQLRLAYVQLRSDPEE